MSSASPQIIPHSLPSSIHSSNWYLIFACSIIMMVEGFDLLIFSNAIPTMLTDAQLELTKASIGTIGSMIFVGMLLGGIFAGKINQALGLIKCIVAGFLLFTLSTALIGVAQSGVQIGLLRLLAGLGLGVVLPTGMAMARQHVQAKHSALAISIVMSGIPIGGMLAAVVSHAIIPSYGWRPLFISGGILGAIVLIVAGPYMSKISNQDHALKLPPNRMGDTSTLASNPHWKAILHGTSRTILMAGVIATLADLLTWYGISVWLTQLMREFDVPFTGAMQLMFTLNVGAIIGSLITATLAIRFGTRKIAANAGIVASVCLLLIASRALDTTWVFVAIAILGMSAISAQNLLNALVADSFPSQYRAAAMGITLGLGRLGAVIAPALGGYILAANYGASWVLIVFAISAVIGALVLAVFTPKRIQASMDELNQK